MSNWQLVALGEPRQCLALLDEAEALARGLDDQTRLGQVLAQMAYVRRMMGDHHGAIAAGQQALTLAAALGDGAVHAQASLHLGVAYEDIGDFGRAAELLRWSVTAADKASDPPGLTMRIQARAFLVRPLVLLGAFAEGRCYAEEALHLAALASRGSLPILASTSLGSLCLAQGDLASAIQLLEQSLALCRASDNRDFFRAITANLGFAYTLQGRLTEGRALLEEAISDSLRRGVLAGYAQRLTQFSEVCRLAGQAKEAWQHAYQALDVARQQQTHRDEAIALHQLGVVHAHADPLDAAQAVVYYQQALALAEALGMRPLQAHCHAGLGTLYATTGRCTLARTELSTAIDLYRAMGMTFWLPQTEAALAQTL